MPESQEMESRAKPILYSQATDFLSFFLREIPNGDRNACLDS